MSKQTWAPYMLNIDGGILPINGRVFGRRNSITVFHPVLNHMVQGVVIPLAHWKLHCHARWITARLGRTSGL